MKRVISIIFGIMIIECAGAENGIPDAPKSTISQSAFNTVLEKANQITSYKVVDPYYVESVSIYDPKTKQMIDVNWGDLNNSQKRDALPLQSAQVTLIQNDTDIGMHYLTGSISHKKGNYTVIMDYMKYRVEPVYGKTFGTYLGNAKIGVGLRIKANIDTFDSDLNLGSLFAIGVQASRGDLRGSISIEVIGIDSSDVTNLIPLTAEIDQTSIQSALQALASIKTKIYDDKSIITPHLVAISESKEGAGAQIIEQKAKITK
jgi:hypothetical protein